MSNSPDSSQNPPPARSPLSVNRPLWKAEEARRRKAFQEVWYLKVNDPVANSALWLRFTLLISGNGFRRVAETWAVHFQKNSARDVTKLAWKQSHDLQSFSYTSDDTLRIGECELSPSHTKGHITANGKTIAWDLRLQTGHQASFNLIPQMLRRTGVVKNTAVTVAEDLRFDGTIEIDGQRTELKNAAGMQAHLSGPKNGHSWVWGHCNLMVDGQGKPVPFLFEGMSAKARLFGSLSSPRLSTFYFHYEGKAYVFNSLWDALRVKSHATLTEWNFQADRGDLSFRGKTSAESKDFAGLTYEDTNGSLLYCANSKLSNLEIHIYRHGKLENTFYSHGTTAFEVVSRQKNPYVPILV